MIADRTTGTTQIGGDTLRLSGHSGVMPSTRSENDDSADSARTYSVEKNGRRHSSGDLWSRTVGDDSLIDPTVSILLAALRDPSVHSVEESVNLDEVEISRTIKMTLAIPANQDRIVVDILRPKKGFLPRLRITGSSANDWRRLAQSEQEAISVGLIHLRFGLLCETLSFADGRKAGDNRAFAKDMTKCLAQLQRIPAVSPSEAAAIMAKQWTTIWVGDASLRILTPMKRHGPVHADALSLQYLDALCQMLAKSYLALVEFATGSAEKLEVEYNHTAPVDDATKKVDSQPGIWRTLSGPYRAILFHIPLAKKTDHYSVEIESPDDYFISSVALSIEQRNKDAEGNLKRRIQLSNGRRVRELAAAEDVEWACTVSVGRQAILFVRNGKSTPDQLWVKTSLSELPAGPSLRTLAICGLTTVHFLLFTAIATVAHPYPKAAAALTVSVLVLVSAVVRDETPQRGAFNAPLTARVLRLSAALLTAAFAAWLISHDTVSRTKLSWFNQWWEAWAEWGGISLTFLMFVLTAFSARRWFATVPRYLQVIKGKASVENLYLTKEM